MRDVCVRTELCTCCSCSDQTTNVLMLRVQNYECVALLVRELVRRMPIQNVTLKIHFPVPKCLCKQGTNSTRVENDYSKYDEISYGILQDALIFLIYTNDMFNMWKHYMLSTLQRFVKLRWQQEKCLQEIWNEYKKGVKWRNYNL